jgi:hypothetical protein
MRALIWKEIRENVKWVPLPGLVILFVFLLDKPLEPMFSGSTAYFFCLPAVVFAAALGFVQIYFEAHGDKRAVLCHRPLSRSRIFLAKATAGIGLYALALGIPFVWLEFWLATPGNLAAPYHWQTSLPWLADILSGLVYYFAGMLVAQREARWYGSRALPLATSFFCSYLVWALPEFWQALAAIGIIGLFVSVAAWGSFCAGGAYLPQPRLAKTALCMTMLLGLLILSMMGKQRIGEWLDLSMHYQVDLTHDGSAVYSTHQEGRGEIALTDVNGEELDLKNSRNWRANAQLLAELPVHWGYRHNGRFYVECRNITKAGNERWLYGHAQGRLLGYDGYHHHFLGSFGPDGFTPADQQPGKGFEDELLFITNRWQYITSEYLIFPSGVYYVDFVGRSIRKFFTPAPGETVVSARWWNDYENKQSPVVVGTNRAFHLVTEEGVRQISLPRAFSSEKYGPNFIGKFTKPDRYFVWYHLRLWLREPEDYRTEPSHLIEYDASGNELARREVAPFPYPATSYAVALHGLVTPMAEASTLVGASKWVRSLARANGSTHKYALIDYLENFQYYIPGTATMATTLSPATQPPIGLIPGYIGLILLTAIASALSCFVLSRRNTFSLARCTGWTLLGFAFGWVGLVLMLVVQEWPARIACPKCQKLRIVTRDTCEHCGARHVAPAPDGTEVFDVAAVAPQVVLASR